MNKKYSKMLENLISNNFFKNLTSLINFLKIKFLTKIFFRQIIQKFYFFFQLNFFENFF